MIRLIAAKTDSPVILHLGDFGFWPGNHGRNHLHVINKELLLFDKWLFVTPGNHEDYMLLSRFSPVPGMPGCRWHPDYPRIIAFDRGYRWEWLGKSFMSFGGANSIDKDFRILNKTWWEGEQITDKDVDRGVENGKVDFMVSHDCPDGVTIEGTHRDPKNWSPEQFDYAVESRKQLRKVVDTVQPRVLFHGHYHKFMNFLTNLHSASTGEDYTLKTYCLSDDYSARNIGVLNIQSEHFVNLEIPKPEWKFPYKLEDAWWLDTSPKNRKEWWH